MGDHPVTRPALPLALGVVCLGLAAVTAWLAPDARAIPAALGAFGTVAAGVGVYRLVDVVDRAARTIVERRRQ